MDEFTTFNMTLIDREIESGLYAIVIEFVDRLTFSDELEIATVYGIPGATDDPYRKGEAFTGDHDFGFVPLGGDLVFAAEFTEFELVFK
jgi:hypothetical protein